jgi:hypothetical protein
MRRIFFLIFLIFLLNNTYGQKIKGALIAGFNIAQVDGDEVFGFKKFGFNAGPSVIIPLGTKFLMSIETIYNQKGSYEKNPKDEDVNNGRPYYNLRLTYVEVPVLFCFEDKGMITFGTGISWGRLVNAKEYEYGVKTSTTIRGPYTKNDMDFLLDIRFRLIKNLKFNIRYTYSITKIRNRIFQDIAGNVWDRDQYNNLLTFRFIYVFNEAASIEHPMMK